MTVMNALEVVEEFFDTYARALLDRDATAIANHYSVPALVAAPQQLIAVSDASETEAFFASAFGQYDGVTEATPVVIVLAATEHSIWAQVTWSYDGVSAERNMYQLVRDGEQWRIAVLTPLEL